MGVFNFPANGVDYYADEVGKALATLVARMADGTPQTGVLGVPDAVVTAVPGAWKVQVRRFGYVHSVSGAVTLNGLDSPVQVDIDSAAGIATGQARIDVVTWNPLTVEVGVTKGAVSASPVAPATPGLARLATVRVNAGDASVNASRVVDVADRTALAAGGGAGNVVAEGTATPALAGSSAVTNGIVYQDFTPISFGATLPSIPKVRIDAVTPWGAVQWYQVFEVTTAGFKMRAMRVGAQPIVSGVRIDWEARL